MSNIALVFGAGTRRDGRPKATVAADMLNKAGSDTYTGFGGVQDYIDSYGHKALVFDKVILLDAALEEPQTDLENLFKFLIGYSRRTSVIYIVTSATSQNNIDLFNKISRESLNAISGVVGGTFSSSMLYAVAKIMRGVSEAGNPAIGLKDLRNISAMSPMDARRMYSEVNPQDIETDEGTGDIEYNATPAQEGSSLESAAGQQNTSSAPSGINTNEGGLGVSDDDMHSVTGWMNEEEEDSPAEDDSPVVEDVPVEEDTPSLSSMLSEVADDVPSGDSPDPSREQFDISDVAATLIVPSRKMLVVFSPTDDLLADTVALKLGLHNHNIGKSTVIVDLESSHSILNSISDEVNVDSAQGGWSISANSAGHVDNDIYFVSNGMGSVVNADTVREVSRNKSKWLGVDNVIFLVSIDIMRAFEENIDFSDVAPEIPQVVLVSGSTKKAVADSIIRLTGDAYVGNNIAAQYGAEGLLAWSGDGWDSPKPPMNFVYDRVAWYK